MPMANGQIAGGVDWADGIQYGQMPAGASLIPGGPLASTPAASVPTAPAVGGKSAQDEAMMEYLMSMGEFTPLEAAQKRKEAMAGMMRQDGDSPVLIDTGRLKVASPWAALGNAANKVGGALMAKQADREQTAIGGKKINAFGKLKAKYFDKPAAEGLGGGTDTLAGDTNSLRAALLAAAQAGENRG
jgi:hypothetical protein